jgi:histone H3/H4
MAAATAAVNAAIMCAMQIRRACGGTPSAGSDGGSDDARLTATTVPAARGGAPSSAARLTAADLMPARRTRHDEPDALCIPRENVRLLVRELLDDTCSPKNRGEMRVTRQALDALHTALEAYAAEVFTTTGHVAHLASRATVQLKFLRAAARFLQRRAFLDATTLGRPLTADGAAPPGALPRRHHASAEEARDDGPAAPA